MVFRKCKDGESKIDWIKSIAVASVFLGLTIISLRLSIEANAVSRENSIEIKNIKDSITRIDSKLDRVIEKK